MNMNSCPKDFKKAWRNSEKRLDKALIGSADDAKYATELLRMVSRNEKATCDLIKLIAWIGFQSQVNAGTVKDMTSFVSFCREITIRDEAKV